ncbi:MAG: InlB B-repeat-containing protein, partial [Clostridia bacterium]|nr:InlB B-repeat-containing protein [Clostridia bacterium]
MKIKKNQLLIIPIMILISVLSSVIISIVSVNTTKEFSSFNNVYANESMDYYCLRDELLIYTEDQTTTGLCWDFVCNKVFETLMAKKYHSFVDFSEGWIALCDKVLAEETSAFEECLIGGGGTFDKYLEIVNTYGMVLEEDFDQEYIYNLDSENFSEYYRNISSYSTMKYSNMLERVSLLMSNLATDDTENFKESDIENIKSHLVTHSAVSLRIDTSQLVVGEVNYLDSTLTPNSEWHSVTIIGWDDNRVIIDKNNTSHTGAFIVLNSWGEKYGNDGIFYIPYSATNIGSGYGLKFKNDVEFNEFTLNKMVGASNFEILNKNKYSSQKTQTKAYITQYNVFQMKDNKTNVILDYDLNLKNNFEINSIQITRAGETKTDNFNIFYDDKKLTIQSKSQDLEFGVYRIEIKDGNVLDTQTFYIISGAEIGSCVTFYSNNFTGINSDKSRYTLFNNLSTNKTLIIEEFLKKENNKSLYCSILINMGTYTTLTEIEDVSYQLKNSQEVEVLTFSTESEYAKGYFFITLGNLKQGKNEFKFTLLTKENNVVEYKIILYRYYTIKNCEDETEEEQFQKDESLIYKQSKVYIVYNDFNSYNNNEHAVSYFYLTEGNTIELNTPKKDGYTFLGWYSDAAYTKQIKELDHNLVQIYDGTNYVFDINGIGASKSKTIFVYAKFLKIDIECTYDFLAYTKEVNSLEDYQLLTSNTINYGDKLKLEISNLSYTVITENVSKNDISYKIYWNRELSETFETFKEDDVRDYDLRLGNNTVRCQIVFFYKEFIITSCQSDFVKNYTYTVESVKLKGDNALGKILRVPDFTINSDYLVKYEWFYGSNDIYIPIEDSDSNELLITNDIVERIIYCNIKIYKNNLENLTLELNSNSRYVFNSCYSIYISADELDLSLPVVNYPIKVVSDYVQSQEVEVLFTWKSVDNEGNEQIIQSSNSPVLENIPQQYATQKIFCQIEMSCLGDQNIQTTNKLTILDVKYQGEEIYGNTIEVIGISSDYDYDYLWNNGAETSSVKIGKSEALSKYLLCKIWIDFGSGEYIEVALPTLEIKKRNIEIIIEDKETFYGESLLDLTYTFAEGKDILEIDKDYFDIELKKEDGLLIGEYNITLSKFDILEDNASNYYNTEYKVSGQNGKYGVYTIKKLEFDFSKTVLVDKDTKFEYNQDSFTFDGKSHGVELINLPEGLINFKFRYYEAISAGTYRLSIISYEYESDFYETHYNAPKLGEYYWEWKINKKSYDINYSWNYTTAFSYNGMIRSVKINDIPNLPIGLKISYIDNEKIDAGEYVAKCIFDQSTLENNNYYYNFIGTDLVWRIEKISLDFDCRWNYSEPFVYDGTQKEVKIDGEFPYGIKLVYQDDSNKATNVGKYTAKATFEYNENNVDLYSVVLDLEWEIKKCVIDITDYKWNYSGDLEYNGQFQKIEILSLPEQITPRYSGNENIDPNTEYIAEVSFEYDQDNYELVYDPSILTQKWKIEKHSNEIVVLSPKSYVYDGKIKNVTAFSVSSPDGSGIKYTYKYKATSNSPEEILHKNNCRFVGYYTVIIECPETFYYKGA